ncbi:MAG: flavodoxin family protein [Spirochaetes bacterium]|nr:flavodoxin family protein [Spirochaetota bacterium]
MKVIAINSSPRKNGNTASLINYALDEIRHEGFETEYISLAGKSIRGCTACYKCFENQNRRCAIDNDILNELVEKMIDADGIILGSPTYFADVNAEMKALIDRAGFVSKSNGDLLKYKVGAAAVAVRRAGSVHVFDSINHFFLISQMIISGSSYWNMGIGMEAGDVEKDEEGINTMKILGRNMSWLLKRIK